VSGAIARGKIPESWFDFIEKNYNVTRADLLKDLPQERSVSVADLSYGEAHLPQNKPPTATVSDQAENYSPDEWRHLCLVHFSDLFDYISATYGSDARSIERFKRELRAAMPDFRLWLYGEEEKKPAAGGE